tara:strand:+ start:802 stop:1407 length:606 start_codon:yes stop_codon:yes gene_type:complete
MSKRPGPNKDNLEATRTAFLQIAKKEFCDHGYVDASTTRIVNESGMARGSLYYHFGDKHGLFRAIYAQLMYSAVDTISARMDAEVTPIDALIAGANTFLELCLDDEFRKITLIQSQAAMSYSDRLEIAQQTLLKKLNEALPPLLEQGYFPGHTLATITVFIFGILGEIGRAMDFTENPHKTLPDYTRAFQATMQNMAPKNA